MRLLSIDLAWSGPSGWALTDFDGKDPVILYGEFKVSSSKTGIFHDQEMSLKVYDEIRRVLGNRTLWPFHGIIYEYTDWHRSLHKNSKKEYAMERRAQRTLGMAVAVLTLAAQSYNVAKMLIPLGANEARREFGANRKDAAAHLWAEEYPRFEFKVHKTGFLFDTKFKRDVSDHISDAFVLASVADKRLRLAENVGRSE